jgi:hypothetical protein
LAIECIKDPALQGLQQFSLQNIKNPPLESNGKELIISELFDMKFPSKIISMIDKTLELSSGDTNIVGAQPLMKTSGSYAINRYWILTACLQIRAYGTNKVIEMLSYISI